MISTALEFRLDIASTISFPTFREWPSFTREQLAHSIDYCVEYAYS